MLTEMCNTGPFTVVVSFLRQWHGGKLACTSKTLRLSVLEITAARDFKWRAHDDIEEVLVRVRQQFDFGPEYFPWSKGVGWRRCFELCVRALENARSDKVLRVSAPANPQPLGIVGWASFKVAERREHEWRQRMLAIATDKAFACHGLKDYKFLPENPTWCVYKILTDLGFRQLSPRDMPRANHPQRLKHDDQLWYREWSYCEDNSYKQFCREVADLKAEVRRGKRFADALAAAGAATKRRKAQEAAEAAKSAEPAEPADKAAP